MVSAPIRRRPRASLRTSILVQCGSTRHVGSRVGGKIMHVNRLQSFAAGIVLLSGVAAALGQQSVARQWDEEMLAAIRRDLARPPVQARNLFHVSIAMYDS